MSVLAQNTLTCIFSAKSKNILQTVPSQTRSLQKPSLKGWNYRKFGQNILKKFSSRDMAGNLIFCFWKRNQIITLSKVAQIQVINTSFDQKLNEESEYYHIFNFWRFIYMAININIFRYPSIFQFFAFFSKNLVQCYK